MDWGSDLFDRMLEKIRPNWRRGQWKVIDANILRAPELESFLGADPSNRVIFSEFNSMECYKGDPLVNIDHSIRIVSRYSNQVVVLKGARQIIRLQATRPTRPRDFVDEVQTGEFSVYCKMVRKAVAGDERLKSQIRQHGRAATQSLNRMLMDAPTFADGVLQLENEYSPEVLSRLKSGEFPKEIYPVIMNGALAMTEISFREHADAMGTPSRGELAGSFIFRYALMGQLLAHRWIADGGIATVKPKRLANDLVDLTHAVYATYFDGLLTRENKWLAVYEQAMWMLREGAGR